MSVYDSVTLTGGDDVFRLLTIHASKPHGHIVCSLKRAYLKEKRQYEAVSYRWGDPKDTQIITLNEISIPIPKTVHDILAVLRLSKEDRVVWIDGLCIDQERLEDEKDSQFRIMKDIFGQCTKTIVWLGLSNGKGQEAVDTLLREPSWLQRLMRSKRDYPREMNGLLRSDVFTRIWVIQEIALAPKVILQYGSRTYDWDRFMEAINRTSFSGDFVNPRVAKSGSGHLHPSYFVLSLDKTRQLIRRGRRHTILGALRSFQPFGATLKIDKVYGLLGLLENQELIKVNNSENAPNVFQQCVLASMEETMTCQTLLSCVPRAEGRGLPGLPSWVPDWSDTDASFPKLFEDALAEEVFDACAGTQLKNFAQVGDGRLSLYGTLLDTIEELGSPLPTLEEFRDSFWPAESKLPRKTFLQVPKKLCSKFRDWRDVIQRACPNDKYRTLESSEDAFWNTLNRGQSIHALSEDDEMWAKWFKASDILFFTLLPLVSNMVDAVPWPVAMVALPPLIAAISAWYITLAVRGVIVLKAPPEKPVFSQHGWVPGRTINNLVGLFPAPMLTSRTEVPSKAGDAVVLFRGASRPFVLRQEGQTWRLIGDAYVHGVMFGAAFRNEDCVVFDLA